MWWSNADTWTYASMYNTQHSVEAPSMNVHALMKIISVQFDLVSINLNQLKTCVRAASLLMDIEQTSRYVCINTLNVWRSFFFIVNYGSKVLFYHK